MTTEKKTITVNAYRDKDGQPSCALDFERGEVCEFYRTSAFGTKERCVFASYGELLHRRGDGTGTLIPLSNCPIWRDSK